MRFGQTLGAQIQAGVRAIATCLAGSSRRLHMWRGARAPIHGVLAQAVPSSAKLVFSQCVCVCANAFGGVACVSDRQEWGRECLVACASDVFVKSGERSKARRAWNVTHRAAALSSV